MNESSGARQGHDKASVLKLVGLAAALGVGTWFLAPMLLPVKVPADFPPLPGLEAVNPELRALLEASDREARRKPASAEEVGKLAMVYHANLLYGQAAKAYGIAERLAASDPRWTYAQAVLQEEMGGEKEQVRQLRRTLELKPDHVPALLKLADALFKVDGLDEAERYYTAAARAPGDAVALQAGFGLGRIAARRKQWEQVTGIIGPLTQTYPESAPLYELLQEAYTGLGQNDKAAEARQGGTVAAWKSLPPLDDPFGEQLLSLCHTATRLLKQAGLFSRVGYPDRAIETGRRAVQADPRDADAHNFLARTLLTFRGEKPEAIEEALAQLEECLKLRPQDPVPLGGFATDFFKSPKPPAMVARVRDMLRSRSGIPGEHFLLGLAADALGETAEAVAQYQAALKENPNNSTVYNKLGLIAEQAGQFDEAARHFQKAIRLNPLNTDARLNLAIELMQRGNYGAGFQELDELLRMNPHDAAAHFCKGFALLSMKRAEPAIASFQQGLRYRPEDAEAHFGLGSALAASGKRDEAVSELRRALQLRPGHRPARQLLEQLER
jgi:tetratricopeptide (TPR) repeat protein